MRTHQHLSRGLEYREEWSAPRPFAYRESSEMERRHSEQEERPQHERGNEVGAGGIAVREDDGAEDADDDARDQGELHR